MKVSQPVNRDLDSDLDSQLPERCREPISPLPQGGPRPIALHWLQATPVRQRVEISLCTLVLNPNIHKLLTRENPYRNRLSRTRTELRPGLPHRVRSVRSPRHTMRTAVRSATPRKPRTRTGSRHFPEDADPMQLDVKLSSYAADHFNLKSAKRRDVKSSDSALHFIEAVEAEIAETSRLWRPFCDRFPVRSQCQPGSTTSFSTSNLPEDEAECLGESLTRNLERGFRIVAIRFRFAQDKRCSSA